VESYTVPGWPASVRGITAVTPHMNRLAASGAVQYKDRVTGQPGTSEIPAAGPPVPADRTSQAMMGTSRSGYGQGFRPNLYYARPERSFWPGAGMPVSRVSDNLMPVPATDPRGVPAVLAKVRPRRGNRQIISRPVLNTWPAWNAS
jgi:hypothetical protein